MRDTHFSEAQTLVPFPRGCGWGGGQRFRAPSQRFRSRRWRWAAALRGSLSGSGGPGACPQLSPGSGHGRPAGSELARAARGPLLKSWDPKRRGAAGAPGLSAPAPAAQLLRMTSSHSAPPPPTPSPHLLAGGGAGGCVRKFPGPLGDVVSAPLKGGCQSERVTPESSGDKAEAEPGWGPTGAGLLGSGREAAQGEENSGVSTTKVEDASTGP